MYKVLIIAVLLGISTTSCLTYEDVEVKSVEDFRVENLLSQSKPIKFFIDVKIDNPNNYKIKLKKADLNLYVADKDLGKVHLDKVIKIPKKGESVQTVIIAPESRDVIQAALSGGLKSLLGGNVKIRIKGRIKGQVMGIGKWIDIDHKEELNLRDKLGL